MMGDLVYFVENPREGGIWVGRNGESAPDRPNQHRSYGYTDVLAYMPGTTTDEDALHAYFKRHAIPGGDSRYEADALYGYIAWLLDRGFASPDRDVAVRLPSVPWGARGPRAWGEPDEALDGQLTLMAAMPPSARVKYAGAGVLATKSSETDEWFTPEDLIEVGRTAMGSIDTDPATHADANERYVRARTWYIKAQNGLRSDLPWEGNVWLNPPYGRGEGSASAFIRRLVHELQIGTVKQAVTCLNSDSMTSHWFDPVWVHAVVHLVVRGRPNFWRPGEAGTSPTKGTVLSYFGPRHDAFTTAASPYGHLVKRVNS